MQLAALAGSALSTAGAAVAGATASQALIASTAISAVGSLAAGAAQKRAYDAQARQAEIRGRSQAIAYKQQGADALRNLNETLAAVIARSAAGGVDPTSGSAATVQQYAMSEGAREFNIAADNSVMALGQADTQAYQYRAAGQAAQMNAFVQAAGTVATGAYRYGQL